MNIKEFSNLVGLSAHTLRYYEKIGLLKNVQRTSSGHRAYTSKDQKWIEFVVRLKEGRGSPYFGGAQDSLQYRNTAKTKGKYQEPWLPIQSLSVHQEELCPRHSLPTVE